MGGICYPASSWQEGWEDEPILQLQVLPDFSDLGAQTHHQDTVCWQMPKERWSFITAFP